MREITWLERAILDFLRLWRAKASEQRRFALTAFSGVEVARVVERQTEASLTQAASRFAFMRARTAVRVAW